MAKHTPAGCSECSCNADESDVLDTLITKFQGQVLHGGQIAGVDFFALEQRLGLPRAKLQISRSTWRVSWFCGCKAEYERRPDARWRPCPSHLTIL